MVNLNTAYRVCFEIKLLKHPVLTMFDCSTNQHGGAAPGSPQLVAVLALARVYQRGLGHLNIFRSSNIFVLTRMFLLLIQIFFVVRQIYFFLFYTNIFVVLQKKCFFENLSDRPGAGGACRGRCWGGVWRAGGPSSAGLSAPGRARAARIGGIRCLSTCHPWIYHHTNIQLGFR